MTFVCGDNIAIYYIKKTKTWYFMVIKNLVFSYGFTPFSLFEFLNFVLDSLQKEIRINT